MLPFLKKGDQFSFENYRPISLLTSISKIFEKVVFDQLYGYFTLNKLIYNSQYGFRKEHSTEFAALELIDKLMKGIDERKIPLSIFLDLSKAFDTLDHKILLSKLQHYGIHNTSLKWFHNYLTDRKQYVEYNNATSKCLPIYTGVPQGSILGPLLIIIYINDISVVSSKFSFILYADDTTMISSMCMFTDTSSQEGSTMSNKINDEIVKVSDWLSHNKLSLDVSKPNLCFFTITKKFCRIQQYQN